ncbi:MAG: hypothetical protein JXQ72_03975 [Anaerolineae bacterium]|nr:hypothetical protein [Anaerolineae bacterium]
MEPGNVILLNGTSSAGKTTLAKVLQSSLDKPYLHLGNDQFLHPNRPKNLLIYGDGTEPTQFEGWRVVIRERQFAELHIGPLALQWVTGMYRAMAAWSASGNDLIADVVLHDRRMLQVAAEVFHPLPVWFISVYCPLDVAEKREQERTENRLRGGARVFYDGVYQHGVFDLVVDTARNSPEECAQQIRQHLNTDAPPKAFRQLHQQFSSLA